MEQKPLKHDKHEKSYFNFIIRMCNVFRRLFISIYTIDEAKEDILNCYTCGVAIKHYQDDFGIISLYLPEKIENTASLKVLTVEYRTSCAAGTLEHNASTVFSQESILGTSIFNDHEGAHVGISVSDDVIRFFKYKTGGCESPEYLLTMLSFEEKGKIVEKIIKFPISRIYWVTK